MKKAKLISTISGTIGLESFMMDKPALLFGPTFFSHLVYRYNSFLNFREFLKEKLGKELVEEILSPYKLTALGYRR